MLRAGLIFSALLVLGATQAAAQDIRLGVPVKCVLGQDCFLQQYFDTDPGPGSRDYTCNSLSYDGHGGTDFALRDRAQMRAGVEVIAAAAGRVVGFRSNMEDVDVTTIGGPTALKGKDCGNGVRLDHGNGWQTQYCHMRQHSIRVKEGQQVRKGQALGLVGNSGRAVIPHLHLSLFFNDQKVDPFRGLAPASACGGTYSHLWDNDTVASLGYRAGGLLSIGLTGDAGFSYEDAKEGHRNPVSLAPDTPALVAWGLAYGIRRNDQFRVTIAAPDGNPVFRGLTQPHPRDQALAFRLMGKRLRVPLSPGNYTTLVELIRDGQRYDAWQTVTPVR